MNILFFHDHPIVATDGGISRITDSLVGVFSNYGHNVFIVSAKKWVDANVVEKHFYLPNSRYDKECLSFAVQFCKDNKIDLIISQSSNKFSVPFWKNLKKEVSVKLFSYIHNCPLTPIKNYAYQKEFFLKRWYLTPFYYLLKNKAIIKLLKTVYFFKYRNYYSEIADVSDKVLVLNDKLVAEFQFFIPKKLYSKITVVPNCLPIREWNSNAKKEKILLWVGRIDVSVKRIDLMLDAWRLLYKRNSEWKLYVLGDGPYLNYVKNYAQINHFQNIFFEGRVNPYRYYEKASLVAVTSSHESFSLVTLEALQHNAVPVVMNTFPFASTLIKNGENGILVDVYNYKSLAKALESLMNNESMIRALSKNGPRSASKYSPDNIYKMYWKQILEDESLD